MFFIRNLKVSPIVVVAWLATGCAGTLGAGIKEENRDTTGKFDGIWTVEIQKAAGTQNYGQWQVRCGDMRNSFNVRVADGAMVLRNTKDAKKGYVSKDGVFKISIPLEGDAQASISSNISMANGDRKLILTGTLAPDGKKSVGYITYGIAEMGYAGCTAKTKYKFSESANNTKQS